MAGQTILFTRAVASGRRGGYIRMTRQASCVVEVIRARARVLMWIMAGRAGQLSTYAETPACHEADRREAHGDGIFQLGLGAETSGRWSAVALATDLDLSFSRETPGVDDRFAQVIS